MEYAEWGKAEAYGNKQSLRKGLKINQRVPYVFTASKSEIVKKKKNRIVVGNYTFYSELEREIIGVLSCGKNMSATQLCAYLMAKSFYIGRKGLMKTMEFLNENGIVNIVYLRELVNGKEDKSECIVLYHLSRRTYYLTNLLGIPMDSPDSKNILYQKNRGKYNYYVKTILVNQVVLNLLAYGEKIKEFCIEKLYNPLLGGMFEIPLYVETLQDSYMFFVWEQVLENEIFQTCKIYQKEGIKSLKIIFLIKQLDEMECIRSMIQTRKLCLGAIGFSIYSSWFNDGLGEIIWIDSET